MRQMFFLSAAMALPLMAFGWGAGHDVVARAVAERLPVPWPERLQGDALKRFCVDNHYPDARADFKADARVTPEEVAYLAGRKMTNSGQFHSDEGRGVAFTLLVRALRENRPDGALLWLATLAHSTADMFACNHDPIVHLATYRWSDPAWRIGLPDGRSLAGLDLGWVDGVPEARDVWQRKLGGIKGADSGKGGEEALLDVMLAGLYGVQTCAPYGVPILRDASAWTMRKDTASARSLAESLSALGFWAVERLLRDFRAAQRLAAAGTVPEVSDALRDRYRSAFMTFTAERPFGDDSLTLGLTSPPRAGEPAVAVLCEPTWRMNDGMLGFNDRVLAAQATASLRREGVNAVLSDVRRFMAVGASVPQTPAVLVFAQKTATYYSLQPKALTERLVSYRKAGGKIIWIGGAPPDRALCDVPQASVCRADVGKGYEYSWTRLPVGTNAYATLTLKVGEDASHKLARDPSFRAGWQIPSNTTFFKPEAEQVMYPLAYACDSGQPLLVGGAWPKAAAEVAYLPSYALYPYLWTDEEPPLVPFELGLDSQGVETLRTAFAALGCGGLWGGK